MFESVLVAALTSFYLFTDFLNVFIRGAKTFLPVYKYVVYVPKIGCLISGTFPVYVFYVQAGISTVC